MNNIGLVIRLSLCVIAIASLLIWTIDYVREIEELERKQKAFKVYKNKEIYMKNLKQIIELGGKTNEK